MSNGPIQRLHLNGSKLDGNLEVRNWLDSVEDKCNDVLGPVWSELMPLVSELVAHEGLFGRGSAHELEERIKQRVEQIVKEYGTGLDKTKELEDGPQKQTQSKNQEDNQDQDQKDCG